jgi:hypothetical protein
MTKIPAADPSSRFTVHPFPPAFDPAPEAVPESIVRDESMLGRALLVNIDHGSEVQ